MLIIPSVIQIRALRGEDGPSLLRILPRVLLAQVSGLPLVTAGVLIFADVRGALYWMVPGVIASLLATVLNAWVLLVEILR
jgi:hypothetical protein